MTSTSAAAADQEKLKTVFTMEENSQGLLNLCSTVISDLKLSGPAWDEFMNKANRLHNHTRNFVVSFGAFIDSFQKIADIATKSAGGQHGDTKEIGATLTRICLRQRSVESKLKSMDRLFNENILIKLNQEIVDWKKNASNMDKEYLKGVKEYKKRRNELRKKVSSNLKLQNKIAHQDPRQSKNRDIQRRMNEVFEELSSYHSMNAERQKQSLRFALLEERSQFCTFYNYLRPYFDMQVSISDELILMNDLLLNLDRRTKDSEISPDQIEQCIMESYNKDYGVLKNTQRGTTRTRPLGPIETLARCTRVVSDRRRCSSPSLASLFSMISTNTSSKDSTRMCTSSKKTKCSGSNGIQSISSKDCDQYDAIRNGLYNLSRDSGFTSQDHFYSTSSKATYSLCLNYANNLNMANNGNNVAKSNPNLMKNIYFNRNSNKLEKHKQNPSKRPLLNSKLFYPPVNDLHRRNNDSLDSFDVTVDTSTGGEVYLDADKTLTPTTHNNEIHRQQEESFGALPLPPSTFFDEEEVKDGYFVNNEQSTAMEEAQMRLDDKPNLLQVSRNKRSMSPIYESTSAVTQFDCIPMQRREGYADRNSLSMNSDKFYPLLTFSAASANNPSNGLVGFTYEQRQSCSGNSIVLASSDYSNSSCMSKGSIRNPLLAEIEKGVQLRKVKRHPRLQ